MDLTTVDRHLQNKKFDLAHVKIGKEHIQKLDDRSKKMVYLGKEPESKAQQLYDPSTGRLIVSTNVVIRLQTQGSICLRMYM